MTEMCLSVCLADFHMVTQTNQHSPHPDGRSARQLWQETYVQVIL